MCKVEDNLTVDEIHKVRAQWGRTPKRVSATNKRLASRSSRKLFDESFKNIRCLKIPTPSEFAAMCNSAGCRRLYFGRKTYEGRTVSIDSPELLTVTGGWLADSVVEWIIATEVAGSSKNTIYVVEPYAAAALFCSSNHRNEELVLTEYRKIILHKKRRLLVPFCDGHHYFLLVIDCEKKEFICIDSKRTSCSTKAADFFSRIHIIGEMAKDTIWEPQADWTIADPQCSQQTGGESWGIYLTEFAKQTLREPEDSMVVVDAEEWRRKTFKQLYLQCYLDHPSCTMCGNFDSGCIAWKCKKCPYIICSSCFSGETKCMFCI